MMKISVTHNIPDIQKRLSVLASDLRYKALAGALNKAAAKGKTEMSRRIRQEFAVKLSDVNPQIRIEKASAKNGNLVAVIEAFPRRRGHRSRNVMLFGAQPVKATKTKRVRVQVKPGAWSMCRLVVVCPSSSRRVAAGR